MAKLSGQKKKLLVLLSLLWQETDEDHGLTIRQIISNLEARGVSAERKSIYSDLEELVALGFDVESVREKNVRYYLASREFELAELKLLVDAVQGSKFITEKKSRELIRKLEGLVSRHEASLLARQVYVSGRIKTMNESIYYTVDEIHRAISRDRKISFHYFSWDLNKEQVLRRGGERYTVSPFALLWEDENYYLVAFDDAKRKLLHFRVDKMLRLSLLEEARAGKEDFADFDLAAYTNRHFGMFGGEETLMTLRLNRHLIGVVLDRFGRSLPILRDGEEHFQITVNVAKSPQFYGWLASLGKDAAILSPAFAREDYIAYLRDTLAAQSKED